MKAGIFSCKAKGSVNLLTGNLVAVSGVEPQTPRI